MKPNHCVRTLLLSLLVAAASSTQAFAQVSVNIFLAPPPPLYEVQPVIAPGYVWAPGYWALNGDRHVWVRGRTIIRRDGYTWDPDRWEQRGDTYVRHVGRWERDAGYYKEMKPKKEKKDKHDKEGHGKGDKYKD